MSNSPLSSGVPPELEAYRKQIDQLDQELIDVLARRFDVVRQVGQFKAKAGLPVVQAERAKMVIARAGEMAKQRGVDPVFAEKLYEMMIDVAHEMEHQIVDLKDRG